MSLKLKDIADNNVGKQLVYILKILLYIIEFTEPSLFCTVRLDMESNWTVQKITNTEEKIINLRVAKKLMTMS